MRRGILMLTVLLHAPAWADAAPPEPEDLAEQGAGIEEILEAAESGPWERIEARLRWTLSGASLRTGVEEGPFAVDVNRSSSSVLRWSSHVVHERWAILAGGWRATSASGLLQVGDGRTRLPGADGAPVALGGGAGGDVSAWRRRPVDGALLVREGDGWRVRLGLGREAGAESVRCVSLGRKGRHLTWDLWTLERAEGRAASVAASLRGDQGEAWSEAAWADAPGRPAAWQAGAAWRAEGGWRGELAWAAADAGLSAVSAGRSPLIPGEAGEGWALRVVRAGRDGRRAALLLAGGSALRPDRGPDEQDRRTLAELRLGLPLGAGVQGRWRLRWRSDARSGWEGREPWEPPSSTRRTHDLAAGADLEAAGAEGAWRLSLRARGQDGGEEVRRRLLLTLGRDHPLLGGQGRLRVGMAWGDDLALVTVAAPAPGAVTLSHWGDRDAETSVGWRGSLGPLTAACAAWWGPAQQGGAPSGILVQIEVRPGPRAAF